MKSWKIYIYNMIARLLPETRCFSLKSAMLRWCGAKIGSNVRINSSAHILGIGNLEIGNDVWIGNDCIIMPMSPATLKIGNCVDIAPGVYISTGTHEINHGHDGHSAGIGMNMDIIICDGAWLGACSVVLPNVTIGERAVIGAGALVNRNIPSHSVAVGIPAKPIRNL